jgi:hypothetical protein
MEKRRFLLKLLSVGTAVAIAEAPVFSGEAEARTSAKTKYAYSAREAEGIHFFPVEEARWNGYEVTTGEWGQLSDFLKMRYLRDARTELEVRENSVILVSDMNRLVKAMDESIQEVQGDPKLKEMPVITFFHIMLLRNNAIKKAWTLVKLPRPAPKS